MNSEAKYWEAYDKAKQEALKMAAQLSAHEKGVMVQGLRWGMIDEARHNEESNQGKFEESFHSLDIPYDDGKPRVFNDGCISANQLYYNLDWPYREWRRWRKMEKALDKLQEYPMLWLTLAAIYAYRFDSREKICSVLRISEQTYRQRFHRVTQILKISI